MGLEENYQELAIAIIKQAAKDWQLAAKRLDGRAILRKLQEVQ